VGHLGKRRSSERSDTPPLSYVTPTKVSKTGTSGFRDGGVACDANVSCSLLGGDKLFQPKDGDDEFDRLAASPDFLTALERADRVSRSRSNRPDSTTVNPPLSRQSDSVATPPTSKGCGTVTAPADKEGVDMSENNMLLRAVQESLKEVRNCVLCTLCFHVCMSSLLIGGSVVEFVCSTVKPA
jgi:hypothetical protein